MKHALLPHGPWVYLPDGRMSRPPGPELLPGMQTIPGFYDDYLRHHNEQRQLLQLGFADRLLGRLIARLKREGIYDDTLVVVTADHGFAWKVGVDTRRSVSLSNVDELGPVPMIVKRPGQHARPRERRARADARRDADDRGRAERAARLPRRRALGLLARGGGAPDRADRQARLQLGGEHLEAGAGSPAAPRWSGGGCASSARATGRACSRRSGRAAS